MPTPLNKLISDYKDLYQYLLDNGQVSLAINIEDHYRKIFLLSCASYYESQLQDIIKKFVEIHSTDERVLCFLTNKAISRQYHTYFSWEANNINSFLGLFGNEFKSKISVEIKASPDLSKYVSAFLIIGNERNKMVHENFLSYPLEKTFQELESLNQYALKFLDYIRHIFDN